MTSRIRHVGSALGTWVGKPLIGLYLAAISYHAVQENRLHDQALKVLLTTRSMAECRTALAPHGAIDMCDTALTNLTRNLLPNVPLAATRCHQQHVLEIITRNHARFAQREELRQTCSLASR